MSPDKVLHNIQNRINELAPVLELFVEDSIHPTANDCERLQRELTQLQELLAVYKFQKQEKEISPSFHIHAKLSEIEVPKAQTAETHTSMSSDPVAPVQEPAKEEMKEMVRDSFTTEAPVARKQMSIAINDKFRFINELFSRNASEYGIAIEQLNTVGSWHDAEVYLNSLKSLYQWREHDEITRLFFSLVKKRFD